MAGRKRDQGVLADPADVPIADHIGQIGQRTQRGPVPFGPDRDHLAVGAVHLGTPDRQPGGEGGVQLGQGGEAAAGEHVASDDLDLAFHPSLGLGSIRGGQPNREVVVAGEGQRLGMQRGGLAAAHMAADDRLGSVIDDRGRHPAEVGERPPVTVPEAAQVLGGDIAAERVPRIRQGHVEAVGVQRPGRGLELTLVAPVDLGLGPGQDLKAPVEAGRLGLSLDQAGPVLPHIDLDPLIVTVQAVLVDQPLPDHAGLQPRLPAQPGIDQVRVRVGLPWARSPLGRRRRARARLGRQIALDGAPVITGLPGNLGPGRPGLGQRLEGTQFHPLLLREDHELPSSGSADWSLPTGGWPSRQANGSAHLRRPTRQAVRQTTCEGVRGQVLTDSGDFGALRPWQPPGALPYRSQGRPVGPHPAHPRPYRAGRLGNRRPRSLTRPAPSGRACAGI